MQQILKIIELVATKYIDDIELILNKDFLTLQYMYDFNNQRDVYKLMQIIETKGELTITFYPEKTSKVITIKDLENIFEEIKKQIKEEKHEQ